MAKKAKITKAIAMKVLEVVDAGLSSGKGYPEPGKMCVEAAVAFAMGEEFSDEPKCVMTLIRNAKISINDSAIWNKEAGSYSSYDPAASKLRAKALRRLAIAQLGSKGVVTPAAWSKAITDYVASKDPAGLVKSNKEKLLAATKELAAAQKALKAGKEFSLEIEFDPYSLEDYATDGDDIFFTLQVKTAAQAKKVCEDLVQILIKLKSPGTKFLYLTEK